MLVLNQWETGNQVMLVQPVSLLVACNHAAVYFPVVEAFFLNDKDQYLEVEFCP